MEKSDGEPILKVSVSFSSTQIHEKYNKYQETFTDVSTAGNRSTLIL